MSDTNVSSDRELIEKEARKQTVRRSLFDETKFIRTNLHRSDENQVLGTNGATSRWSDALVACDIRRGNETSTPSNMSAGHSLHFINIIKKREGEGKGDGRVFIADGLLDNGQLFALSTQRVARQRANRLDDDKSQSESF